MINKKILEVRNVTSHDTIQGSVSIAEELSKLLKLKEKDDRLERIIRAAIKDLEKRKDKAMVRTDTDNLWTKNESLQWVLLHLL
jgi:translation initiation factor 2B subunit (eIF-2B alpha/beta/delta family)